MSHRNQIELQKTNSYNVDDETTADNEKQHLAIDNKFDDLQKIQSTPLPQKKPDGGYGWVVVLGSFLCNFYFGAICFPFGKVMSEFNEYFKCSLIVASLVGSFLFGLTLLCAPLGSTVAKMYGCRVATMFGSVVTAIGLFISALSTNIYMLICTAGIIGGFGFSFIFLPSVVVCANWFDKRKALATGLGLFGLSAGGFAGAPLTQWLLDVYAWRGCLMCLAGIALNIALAGALFRPVESVTNPGRKIISTGSPSKKASLWSTFLSSFDVTLFKLPSFLCICASGFCAMFTYYMPYQITVKNCQALEFSKPEETIVIMTMSIMCAIGRILCGWAADKTKYVDVVWLNNVSDFIAGGACILVQFLNTFPLMMIYAVLFGLFIAGFSTLRSIILIEIIGIDRLASSLGWTFMFQGVGAILGSPLATIVYELTKSYGVSFAFSGSILIVAGLFGVPLRCLARTEKAKAAKRALEQSA